MGDACLAMWRKWNQICKLPGWHLDRRSWSVYEKIWWSVVTLKHWNVQPDEGRTLIKFALDQVQDNHNVDCKTQMKTMMIQCWRMRLCTDSSTLTSASFILASWGTPMRERCSTKLIPNHFQMTQCPMKSISNCFLSVPKPASNGGLPHNWLNRWPPSHPLVSWHAWNQSQRGPGQLILSIKILVQLTLMIELTFRFSPVLKHLALMTRLLIGLRLIHIYSIVIQKCQWDKRIVAC